MSIYGVWSICNCFHCLSLPFISLHNLSDAWAWSVLVVFVILSIWALSTNPTCRTHFLCHTHHNIYTGIRLYTRNSDWGKWMYWDLFMAEPAFSVNYLVSISNPSSDLSTTASSPIDFSFHHHLANCAPLAWCTSVDPDLNGWSRHAHSLFTRLLVSSHAHPNPQPLLLLSHYSLSC